MANRRPQAQKSRNPRFDKVLDLRRGSRTMPVPAGNVYRRKPKHGVWE